MVGDKVTEGDVIGSIHANDAEKLAEARAELWASISWSETAVDPLPHFYTAVT